jgi:tetratricopeptide (TPR) repeat protein
VAGFSEKSVELNMPSPHLILSLLLALCVALATQLSLWHEQSDRSRAQAGSVIEILMGDSRRLFANHFFTKADVYLHSGVYPSIFDQAQNWEEGSHLSHEASGCEGHDHDDDDHDHDHEHGDGFRGRPKDWIDAFGRNFIPTRHTHLSAQESKEILPWLRMAAELNPNQIETYTVTAYWLRRRLDRVDEAQQFLREGWRANPDSYEIIFELGRLFEEDRKDDLRARNLFELALRKWERSESGKAEPDKFVFQQITGHLARLEEREERFEKALEYLELLRAVSPNPDKIQEQIAELRLKIEK